MLSCFIRLQEGSFTNARGDKVVPKTDENQFDSQGKEISRTIRHTECELLTTAKDQRCKKCKRYRAVVRAMKNCCEKKDLQVSPVHSQVSLHINNRYIKTPEKLAKLKTYQVQIKSGKQEIYNLRKLLDESVEAKGMPVDVETHSDLLEIMQENSAKISEAFPNNSFRQLFWTQQLEAAMKKNPKEMRWHPLMVKWCLSLKLRSSAYEQIYDCRLLKLPSQRTLRDYTHVYKPSSGFSDTVDETIAKLRDIEHLQKQVVFIFDEMHVKKGLVFDKVTRRLKGFFDLGTVTGHLLQFEVEKQPDHKSFFPTPAKSMLTLMLRGIFTPLHFPYAQFPCTSFGGD